VTRIVPYRVPRPAGPIDLFLDGNEGAPPDSLELELTGPDLARLASRYPSSRGLQEVWASRLGVAPDRLRVTAGADEAIDRVVRAFVAPGREMLATEPAFEMLERYCALAGGRSVTVPWLDGPLPVDALIAARSRRTALVIVASPNNPTGTAASASDLLRLAAALPDVAVLVDLAYVEFADADPTPAILALPNAIVIRTLSKGWGLAGLRVGCAIGSAQLIGELAAAGNPYPVSALSMAVAERALGCREAEVAAAVDRVRDERGRLTHTLQRLGACVLPSQANFVLARFRDASWTWEALASLGIAVRRFPGRAGLDDALRIACPADQEAFARLARALTAALAPQALLFDMDGVLADVSGSYKVAVVQTAASFGVHVEPREVLAAKASGGANNDWKLTCRLMAERGVVVPLADVTARFEALYQGTASRPGLRSRERCLVDRPCLERLAQRVRLAIVTGRTQADAARFLRDHALEEVFSAMATMEDGPAKPDPAPVRAALRRLGVERAWMIGDTPDDVRAARVAGVVPIGVVAPGDAAEVMGPALAGAGVARVVDTIGDVEALLP
jgi:histidinol-phosphate aminotransferase